MARAARTVVKDVPHHITHRSILKRNLFFTKQDYLTYLKWLSSYCQKYRVEILAYCLMSDHLHLVLKPSKAESLAKVLQPLQMKFTKYINKTYNCSGRLWQGRFYSSVLDENHTLFAIHYIENNPVKAGIVKKAKAYPYSSAVIHCGLEENTILTKLPILEKAITKNDWSNWLDIPELEFKKNINQILQRQNLFHKGFNFFKKKK